MHCEKDRSKKVFENKTTKTGPNTTASYKTNSTNHTTKNQPVGLKHHAVLLLKRQAGTTASIPSRPTVKDRMKHRCLVGADLYVTRLSNNCSTMLPASFSKHSGHAKTALSTVQRFSEGIPENSDSGNEGDSIRPMQTPLTGSLHDELTYKTAAAAATDDVQDEVLLRRSNAAASKPCYRCVNFMHNVGIKRVFWTNDEGEWEGAKIRDLVDQLEGIGCQDTSEGEDESGGSVYVTKHEVLMLRRLFGGY